MDKVSIIVPVYNVEQYLDRCINSLISQTYKNIEILLIDDGSTDNSSDICRHYSEMDNRIIYYHKKNSGLSDARNYGIRKASGSYLCFIDSDDFVECDYVSTLYNNIKRYNVKLSVGGFCYYYENGIKDSLVEQSCLMDSNLSLKKLFVDSSIGNFAWNKMYDISLFDDICFPTGKKMEDLGIMYRIFEKCDYIYFDSKIIYNYVQRNNSILHCVNKNLLVDRLELSIERFLYMQNKNIDFFEMHVQLINVCLDSIDYFFDDDYYLKLCEKYLNSENNIFIFFKLNFKKKIKFLIYKVSKNIYKMFFKSYFKKG